MPTPANSFEKFNYSIRPSKQVERKLLIEAFHYLAQHVEGYTLKDYTYLGMGSVFYTDFVLFHKYLYLDEMICIEGADIKKRMAFNKPYKFIKLKMGKVLDVMPKLRFSGLKYIVWLDYDSTLDSEALVDIDGFVRKLEPGSFLIVTVDAEPRLRNIKDFESRSMAEKRTLLETHYMTCRTGLLQSHLRKKDLARNTIPQTIASIINAKIMTSASYRDDDVDFIQLFNYVYADSSQMLSYGGLLDSPNRIQNVQNSGILEHNSVVHTPYPKKITVPPLTVKEKRYLDGLIKSGGKPSIIRREHPFEIDESHIESYVEHYRHYPSYYESLL